MRSMRPLYLLFIFITFSSAHAAWKVGTKVLNVVPCPNKGCYISKNCSGSCRAFKAYSNPKKALETVGGSNPGSRVCKESFAGKVVVAQDEDGNQEGFCVFQDDSLLSLGGVWK